MYSIDIWHQGSDFVSPQTPNSARQGVGSSATYFPCKGTYIQSLQVDAGVEWGLWSAVWTAAPAVEVNDSIALNIQYAAVTKVWYVSVNKLEGFVSLLETGMGFSELSLSTLLNLNFQSVS